MSVTDLIQVEIGQEAAFSDGAVATGKLMGVTDATLTVADKVHHVDALGRAYPAAEVAEVASSGEGSISMDLSYEDLLYPLDNFFSEFPTPDPATVWSYAPPTTAISVPNHYCIEFGALDATATAEYYAAGVLFTELNISGEAGSIWKGEFPFVCAAVDHRVMQVLNNRVVELIRMADTTIHFDTWGTAAGTAAASASTLVSFELHVENGRHLKTFGGSVIPTLWGEMQWKGTLTTVLEYNAAVKTIVDAMLAPAMVQRAIRINATSAGKYAHIDFYGTRVEGVELFSDRDGNITVSLDWEGTWEPTVGHWLEIVVDNDFVGPLV